jgi:hypothetical protein
MWVVILVAFGLAGCGFISVGSIVAFMVLELLSRWTKSPSVNARLGHTSSPGSSLSEEERTEKLKGKPRCLVSRNLQDLQKQLESLVETARMNTLEFLKGRLSFNISTEEFYWSFRQELWQVLIPYPISNLQVMLQTSHKEWIDESKCVFLVSIDLEGVGTVYMSCVDLFSIPVVERG